MFATNSISRVAVASEARIFRFSVLYEAFLLCHVATTDDIQAVNAAFWKPNFDCKGKNKTSTVLFSLLSPATLGKLQQTYTCTPCSVLIFTVYLQIYCLSLLD